MAVPEDVLAVLEAEAAAFDMDMQGVARRVLQEGQIVVLMPTGSTSAG